MITKPKHLSRNSSVALIAPAGIVSEQKLEKSISNIKKLSLKPINISPDRKNYGYLADTDSQRINELNNAFSDNNYKAIFSIRGGYGSLRILSAINYNLIKKNPKIFIGFSDITAIQSALFQKNKLVSFHGILASSNFSDYTIYQLEKLIFKPEKNYKLPLKSIKILNHGYTQGIIVGGNLSILSSLIGTEYLFNFKNKIVFIEDVNEPPYKIDKMLNHLIMATNISSAAAIVFGKFYKCEPSDFNSDKKNSFSIKQIIKNYFNNFKIPIIYDVNFGHIDNSLIIPIGIKAKINTKNNEIKLLEKTVI
jgi:muramoyltetrapeptide carboxypeptidase